MSETILPDPSERSAPPNRTRWLLLSALLLIGVAVGFGWLQRQLGPVAISGKTQEFEVQPGWGAAQVAGALETAKLVRHARVFSLYLQVNGLDRSVGEGLYELSPTMSAAQLAQELSQGGQPRVASVVIPEGFRVAQVAGQFRSELGLELAPLLKKPGALRPTFVPPGVGLEGYLFPARYDLPVGSTPQEAVEAMLGRFERELTPAVRSSLEGLSLSVHAWVTLSSMVQAEAGSRAEMPIIAGVFLNRLERGMRLQSDPTVAYGLGKALPDLDAVAGDLERDTPWNTYTRAGLPRTPIGNPGAHALAVVFNAERTDAAGKPYLYFLHALNGDFRPNLTLEAHNRDVETYLR